MKLKKQVVILTESQVKTLIDNIKIERDKRITEEEKSQFI
jgi:hypothetical protein